MIAGRADNRRAEHDVQEIIRSSAIGDVVQVLTDLPLADLEAQIARCDVAICLRWPTAGEVDAVLMRALGAGKPVIVSDLAQYDDLDPTYTWKVPTDASREQSELERLMTQVIEQPSIARKAGDAALQFVKTEATAPAVAASLQRSARGVSCARARPQPGTLPVPRWAEWISPESTCSPTGRPRLDWPRRLGGP